jgi:tRNA(Ile)-lysidine synthase
VRYTRNRIRHELLPLARACYPAADEAIRRLSELARAAQDFIAIRVDELLERVRLDKRRDRVTFVAEVTELFEFYLARETLMRVWREMDWPRQGMTFEKWTELADMLVTRSKGTQSMVLPGGIVAQKKGGSLTLSRPKK